MLKTFFTTFNFKKEKFYEEPKYEEQKSSHKEEPKSESKQEHEEFKRFYSDSAYIVLGVSASEDYKTIKKAYRKLVREYHPDLNPNNIKLYTEITQNINEAWEKVESWKK